MGLIGKKKIKAGHLPMLVRQINSVVSSALDRLHSESDPCVKFDPDQKLWMYHSLLTSLK